MSNNYYYPSSQSSQDAHHTSQYSSTPAHQAWNNWPVTSAAIQTHGHNLSTFQAYTSYCYDTAKLAYEARNYANANTQQRYSQESSHQKSDTHDSYQQNKYRSNQYNSNQQSNWQRRGGRGKRPRNDLGLPRNSDNPKKKHKSSANHTEGIKWEKEDAIQALKVEREFGNKLKHHSLIMQFPDPILSKEIVKDFHPAIENVHFQQASTPRFCHITLAPDSDTNIVKNALNRQKFGGDYLTVELKKDKEDDQDISPNDIDPYTLYVDNISTEVSEATIQDKYPKTIKINIGYAQKMKNSRYAFVRFNSVEDSIAAFKDTHKSDMFSRNLKVRFRRIRGNVGMPGETKHQNPPKALLAINLPDYERDDVVGSEDVIGSEEIVRDEVGVESSPPIAAPECPQPAVLENPTESEISPTDKAELEKSSDDKDKDAEDDDDFAADLSLVKDEPMSESSDDEDFWLSLSKSDNQADAAVKKEPNVPLIKTELGNSDDDDSGSSDSDDNLDEKTPDNNKDLPLKIKKEPDAEALKPVIKTEPFASDLSSDSSSDSIFDSVQ